MPIEKLVISQKPAYSTEIRITDNGYVEIKQPGVEEDVTFLLTPRQAIRLSTFIELNADKLSESWGFGDAGDS